MILTSNLDQQLNLTRETKQCQKIDDDFMPEIYDAITISLVYGQFRAIRKPNSQYIVGKTYIFINSNLLSYKNWKQN